MEILLEGKEGGEALQAEVDGWGVAFYIMMQPPTRGGNPPLRKRILVSLPWAALEHLMEIREGVCNDAGGRVVGGDVDDNAYRRPGIGYFGD